MTFSNIYLLIYKMILKCKLNKKDNLYIIGNGFDLFHKLDTKYQSFAKHLSNKNPEIYEQLNLYYGLPDIINSTVTDDEYALWSKFEEALADLDYELVLEENSDLIANLNAPNFKSSDWHSYEFEMERFVKSLTEELKKEFRDFILNVNYNVNINEIKISLEKKSFFISFNYTETLEKLYGIEEKDILYLHKKAKTNDLDIILGHGTDPETYNVEEEIPPGGLSPEDLEEWKEQKSNEYDYSYESAKQSILNYYAKSFKNTKSIIDENLVFYNSFNNIKKVFVLGHSISQVDIDYFEKLKNSLSVNTKWIVTYYSNTEKENHLSTLVNLGVPIEKIKQIKLYELINEHKNQLKLNS